MCENSNRFKNVSRSLLRSHKNKIGVSCSIKFDSERGERRAGRYIFSDDDDDDAHKKVSDREN